MTATPTGPTQTQDEKSARQLIDEAARLIRHWQFTDAQTALFDLLRTPAYRLDPLQRTTAVRLLADASRELGDASRELGDTGLAVALLGPLLTECLRRFGGRHPATLRAAVSYALLLHQIGRNREADRMLRQLLTDPGLGLTRPLARETATATSLRTMIAAQNGRAGTDELQQHLAECDIVLGPDDPHTIRLTIALARAHHAAGDLQTGQDLLAAARQDVLDQHGARHPLVDHLGQALHQLHASAPQTAAAARTAPARRHRWPARLTAAAVTAAVLTLVLAPGVPALTRQDPVNWVAPTSTSRPDPQPRDISITIDADTASIAWTNPAGTIQITLIVTVGGNIRTTQTLPAVTAFAVRGLGPEGIVCAVITATGTHTSGTASVCVAPPRRRPDSPPTAASPRDPESPR